MRVGVKYVVIHVTCCHSDLLLEEFFPHMKVFVGVLFSESKRHLLLFLSSVFLSPLFLSSPFI